MVRVRVDVGSGPEFDRVRTPPRPEQVSPLSQQPYLPFEPRVQYLPTGQPPDLSGQHVAVVSMHPVPHSFWPGEHVPV